MTSWPPLNTRPRPPRSASFRSSRPVEIPGRRQHLPRRRRAPHCTRTRAVHVADIGLLTASDQEILARADDDERVVLSADSDFGTLLAVGRLSKPSLVLLRSADRLAPLQQADLVLAHLPQVANDLATGAIVTLAHLRVRVRLLPVAAEG